MRMALAALLLVSSVASAQPSLPSFAEPSLSPDGREIAFVAGGDIWTVAAGGGEARLLVTDPATEWKPLWSPDGKRLAFASNRTGNGDVYVLDLAGGTPVRITYDDGRDQLDAWSRDGKWLYFHSTSRDVAGMNDLWRVAATGGTPMQVTAERYLNEYFGAPSPDGASIAFAARGIASGQWWRHGSSHIDTSQLWTMDLATKRYEPLGEDGARSVWPMWMPDGKRLWFVSDRGGNENVWSIARGGSAAQVTNFTGGRVLWPTISWDGRTILFERDFAIWSLDTASGRANPVEIRLRGVSAGPAVERRRLTDRFNDFALSPDGKKVALTARGDVFAASAKDGGDAARITNTPGAESGIVWSPDSKSIVYASDRDGRSHLYRYEFAAEREIALTSGESNEYAPRFSPDGKLLAFQRGRRELAVMDVASKQIRTLATALFDMAPFGSDRGFDWSPDGRWIAYIAVGEHGLRNVHVIPASGGDPRQVSFLANAFTDFVTWSRDGKFLLFNSAQRTEAGQIARVDLVPTTPKFREDQFRDLFREPEKKKEEKSPEPSKVAEEAGKKQDEKKEDQKPVEIVFAGIRERVRLIPVGLDTGSVEISPDGKWIAFTASIGESENVWIYSIDELATDPAVPKQISTSAGNKSHVQFSSDSKELFYLDAGKIAAATLDPIKTRNVSVTAEMDVDFAREKNEAFAEGWRLLRDHFYDAGMHGADWSAIRERFAPRVAAARNGDELRRLLNLMVGELNASHLGAIAPGDATRTNTGRIGVLFDRDEYESHGRLRVSEVIPLSPADVAKIKAGDVIVAVDGKAIRNFDAALEHTVNKRTVITVEGSPRRDVVLRPVRNNDEKGLIYRAWVNANREYVEKISNGRLGYVHMINMSAEALNQLHLDLDAENRSRAGVVVDLRNNNGGFVNVYAIDVLARRPYLSMTWRDHPTAGARTLLGQRSLEKPTILLVNRHSLSDAEDFTEGYRTLGLGKVVGEPTAGWIIYTSNQPLIDGTIFRIPFIRITDNRGQNMERNPRTVDVPVLRRLGEKGDAELDAAVKELLAGLR